MGAGVRVGVIDSGVALHPDLRENLVEGVDFVYYNGTSDDITGHGTHVAGIIGATGESIDGVAGVAPAVDIVPLQVYYINEDNKNNCIDTSAVASAINWAGQNNVGILNLSVPGSDSNTLVEIALNNYTGLAICAAGNGTDNNGVAKDNDFNPEYPASYSADSIISVGASTAQKNKYSQSNFGALSVDVFAPGSNIYSTWPNTNMLYHSLSGTSMAAPFVTGIAALLMSKDPTMSAEEIKAIIMGTVDEVDALADKCVTGGIVNAYNAVSHVHSYGYVLSNDNKCQKTCTGCGYIQDDGSHGGYTYRMNGSSTHRMTCLCGEIAVDESHILRITTSAKYCMACDYFESYLGPPTEILPWKKDDTGECC